MPTRVAVASTRPRVIIVRPWVWWATFEIARASGSNVTAAWKAAQKAIARLK